MQNSDLCGVSFTVKNIKGGTLFLQHRHSEIIAKLGDFAELILFRAFFKLLQNFFPRTLALAI